MIASFADKDTEKFWHTGHSHHMPADVSKRAFAKLQMLDAASDINDLLVPPGNQLEKLAGGRKGQYSIRVNKQWRICFSWKNGEAHNVEFIDYH